MAWYNPSDPSQRNMMLGGIGLLLVIIPFDMYLMTPKVVAQLRPRLINLTFVTACGNIPEEVYTLTRLEEFHVEQSNVEGALSPSIGKLVNLKKMYIWGTKMSGPIPKELGDLKNLNECYLYQPFTHRLCCGGTKAGPGFWGPMGGEKYLSFEAGLSQTT